MHRKTMDRKAMDRTGSGRRGPIGLPRAVRLVVAGILFVAASGLPLRAESVPLSWAVPSDALIFLRCESSPNDGFAQVHLKRLRQALAASGALDAYIHELAAMLPADERSQFAGEAVHWKKILAAVDWWGLLSREIVFAARVAADGRFEMILLSRVGADERDRQLMALRAILYGMSAIGEDLEFEIGDRDGAPTTLLYSRADYGEQLAISGMDDVIAVSSSSSLVRRSFSLLRGRARDPGFVHSDRYRDARRALERCPPIGLAGGKPSEAKRGRGRFELYVHVRPVFRGGGKLDAFESYHLDVDLTATAARCRFRTELAGGADNPLASAFESQRPAGDLVRRVPRVAAGFSVASGFAPASAWDWIVAVGTELSQDRFFGEDLIESLAEEGFRPDVLKSFSGRRVAASFSRGGRNLAAGVGREDQVLFLELAGAGSKERVAASAEAVEAWLEGLAKPLRAWQLVLEREPIDGVDGATFSLTVPLLDGKAVFAVAGGGLAVATSETALRAFLDRREGVEAVDWIPRDAEIDAVWSGTWRSTIDTCRLSARLLGLVGTMLPDEESGVLRPLCIAIPRLQGALGTLDFLGETRGLTVRSGREYLGMSVTTLHAVADF